MLNKDRWNSLIANIGQPSCGNDHFSQLVAAYSEPHRHYHNTKHVEHCLQEFDSAQYLAEEATAVEFAIWLHDAVYQPQSQQRTTYEAHSGLRISSTLLGPLKLSLTK